MHLERFDALADSRPRTYEALKRAALAAGRFSALEVTDSTAGLFDQLCSDPAVEVYDLGYPWTGVRLRSDR